MNKKRILLVADVYNWGGHVRAKYIKKHLSNEFDFNIVDGSDFENYVVSTNKNIFTQNDVNQFRQKAFDKQILNIDEFKKFLHSRKHSDPFDLIYILFHTMLLRKDASMLLNIGKKILSIVTAYPVLRASYSDIKTGKKLFLDRANKCVGMIANNYLSLNDLKSIYNGKTWYAPRGVDENVFYPTKEFKEKPDNEFTVAFVGKEENLEKGFLDYIKPACREANVKLIYNQRNYTDALSPDEMREFYNQADAYIVASVMDGTPNPALEAAACGRPIISNHIGNMPELIENHRSGFLVKDREISKYVHRLNWMKKNQRKTWEIGQKGREEVLKNWTWGSVLNKNERRIFREILS